jgi:hypothetical protein
MFCQLTGGQAHEVTSDFLNAPFQRSERSHSKSPEHAGRRKDEQMADLVLICSSLPPSDDLANEPSFIFLYVVPCTGVVHWTQAFVIWQCNLYCVVFLDVL